MTNTTPTSTWAAPADSPLLAISELTIDLNAAGRRIKVVEDLAFSVASGEALALVGESGSGKTVTALSILGLLPPTARVTGSVRFRGKELLGLATDDLNLVRGRQIGIVYQEPMSSLNPAYTVGDQISETMRHHLNLSSRAAAARTAELLELVGIPEPARRMNDYPHTFSGGMLQRVMIAIALCCEPQLLIADEPTTALDATVQAQVLDVLVGLQEKFSMAVLFLTHDLGAAASLCDRVAVMYSGQLVESSSAEPLFDRPLHPYTEGLLNSVARLDRTASLTSIPGTVPAPWAVPSGCRFHPRCAYAETRCAQGAIPLKQSDDRIVRCVRSEELHLRGTA